MRQNPNSRGRNVTRRDFMGTTAAAVGAALAASYAMPSGVYAQASATLKVGLVGCGGRGSGAAVNALAAEEGCELVAMGDMFADKLDNSHENLLNSDYADRVLADDMQKFTGFDAYKGVIDACDVVLLATPPHFRPMHLAAAIDAGKHVFCEKPVAVDVPGVKKVIEACKRAKEKNLAVVSGLCYRYDKPKIEVIDKIHQGAIGELVNLQTNYNSGPLWMNPRQAGWSDMEWQLRNWLYFHWLSGDFVVEQSIHSIDKMMWVMKDEPPVKVSAAGGRSQRTSPEFGNVYDHFNAVIEWKNGTRCFQSSRQWANADQDVSDWAYGTKGTADIQNHRILGANESKGKPGVDMYVAEHEAMFKSIRKNEPINNGDYMTKSTLVSMMVRMSAYTGKTIYWDRAAAEAARAAADAPVVMESTEDLSPPKYEFGPLPVPAIAVPGQTKFI
jgi:predicted dehydrogenase